MIELIDVYKSFEGQPVLKGLSLTIPKGRTTVILGQSGCGKSVTLKIILRLLDLDAGKVIIEGADTSDYSEREMNHVRMRFGMLFQGAALFDSMPVWDNVAYPLLEHYKKMPIDEIDKRVTELLNFVDMPNTAHKLPAELSGGMKKRVSLARSLVTNPDFIFYDEPTTGLDPVTAARINKLIIDTKTHYGATSVVVTHDMVSAFTVGDFFAFVHDGKVVFTGEKKDVLETKVPELRAFLNEAAPKNYIEQFTK